MRRRRKKEEEEGARDYVSVGARGLGFLSGEEEGDATEGGQGDGF